MKRYILNAEKYCKNLNKTVKKSLAYNEAFLYSKFGANIGITECNRIAKVYCAI